MNTKNGKKVSRFYNEDFVDILAADNNCLQLDIYKAGVRVASEKIDPQTEGIMDTVSTYFPYNEAAEKAYYAKYPTAEDVDPGVMPPLHAKNVDYEWDEELEEIVSENFKEYPDCDVPNPFEDLD